MLLEQRRVDGDDRAVGRGHGEPRGDGAEQAREDHDEEVVVHLQLGAPLRAASLSPISSRMPR